jgi:hypothetical protein
VKALRPLLFVVLSLLSACLPKLPEIPLTEVPAGPLVQELEQRRQAFTGLKATAAIQAVRKGRKRAFDNVSILLAAQDRLRLEAYGPLGQSVLALVWNGREVLLRLPGQDRVVRPGAFGLERLLGAGLEVQELCAALSGNIPPVPKSAAVSAACSEGNRICEVTVRQGDLVRRVQVANRSAGPGSLPVPAVSELYRDGKLVFRALFEEVLETSPYLMPRTVIIENPDKEFSLTINYAEVDVNVPIDETLFSLPDDETGAP